MQMSKLLRAALPALLTLEVLISLLGCHDTPTGSKVEPGPPWIVYHAGKNSLLGNAVRSLTFDRDQSIWFATDEGASNFNGRDWTNYQDELVFPGPFGDSWSVNAIARGKDGSVWFGLSGGGVRRFNRSSSRSVWTSYSTPSLPSNMVHAIAVDISGNVWVGTDRGVARFIPGSVDPSTGVWVKYGSSNSPVPDEAIRCVGINPNDNSLWFGTSSQGVVSYDGDVDWNISAPNNAPLPILSMAFTPENIGWFGTYADWVYRYSVKTTEWTQYSDSAHGGGLPDNFVNAVAYRGSLWFGTNSGVVKFDGQSWRTWNTANSMLPSNIVKALAFDGKGNLWIGTENGAAEFNENGTVP
jgi:ligand-binding sensor domain-containing protein